MFDLLTSDIALLFYLTSEGHNSHRLLFPKYIFFVSIALETKRTKAIECVRSCDQKPYLHNETVGGICIK